MIREGERSRRVLGIVAAAGLAWFARQRLSKKSQNWH
jgi:hypothetical protein